MRTRKNPLTRVALYLFVFMVCIIILYPYFVMFTTAAKSNDEMYACLLYTSPSPRDP